MHPTPPRRWPRTPRIAVAGSCPTAAASAATGAPGTCAAHPGARCSCGLSRRARSGNGRIPPSSCMATCSISSGSPPALARCARLSPRRAASWPSPSRRQPPVPARTTAPKRPATCGTAADPSTAHMLKNTCALAAFTAAGSRRCGSIPHWRTVPMRATGAAIPRWSRRSPATTEKFREFTGHGSILAARRRPRSPAPENPSAESTASPCASANRPQPPRCWWARASRPCSR